MGFNSVYQTLKELFPQMDARILKAVAIEHSKDPDGAVESILTEVLPFVSAHSRIPTSNVKSNGKALDLGSQPSVTLGSVAEDGATACNTGDTGQSSSHSMNSLQLNETLDGSTTSSFYDAKDSYDNQGGNSKSDELIASASLPQTIVEANQGPSSSFENESGEGVCHCVMENNEGESCNSAPRCQDGGVNIHVNESRCALSSSVNHDKADVSLSNADVNPHPDCVHSSQSCDPNTAPSSDCHKEQSFVDCNSLEYQDAADDTLLFKEHMLDALYLNLPEPENGMLPYHENQETSSHTDAEFEQESALIGALGTENEFVQDSTVTDAVGTESETVLSTIVTRSGHICRVDLLEDLIENAKSQKDSLFSAVESVMGLIKEVEFQEKAAQQAKEDVSKGGLKTLEKVEELKSMLKHAKEANDMHAGEVYGEKSILATEVKELQTRLLGLSDEKDKSMTILEEMQKTLEARLIIAEEERRNAEQELLEKEASAQSALAEQELVMEKVVQESKLLQQEAEENAKLRDFLMEKGRVVDLLQGEISVISQDVISLKENFDNRISPGKSLILRHGSSRLASSNSSVKSFASSNSAVKSMGSDVGPVQLEFLGSPTKTSRTPSVGSQTPRTSVGEEVSSQAGATPRKELLDEDWELFDF